MAETVKQVAIFNGREVPTFEHGGEQYAAMKPIVEGMGLSWTKQLQLIKRDPVLEESVMSITGIPAADGKTYAMSCLPLKFLNGWLFKVNSNRYKGERREVIIKYQRECYDVLNRYWNEGGAINHRADSEQLAALHDELTEVREQLALLAENNQTFKALDSLFGNRTKFGSPSRTTGNPRVTPVHGYLRSDRKAQKVIHRNVIQLTLNLPGVTQ